MKKYFTVAAGFTTAFILWTAVVSFVDLQQIGPQGSFVGLGNINSAFHNLTGVHWVLYNITDWLGIIPILVCLGFGILGLIQWIQRKGIMKVDYDILVLGIFYFITFAIFLLFEKVVINYRPILINGYLEASYPSSTTLLVICVMTTAIVQFNRRIRKKKVRDAIIILNIFFIIFMVIGRTVSGVHWITDIIGGLLLSAGLTTAYWGAINI